MEKSKELKTTQEIVLDVLKTQPRARNSDNYLYYCVYAFLGRQKGLNVEAMSMPRFFLNMSKYGLPSTETIRRARQKIQADNPELCGSSTVEGRRMMNKEVFRDYARGQ